MYLVELIIKMDGGKVVKILATIKDIYTTLINKSKLKISYNSIIHLFTIMIK